VSALAGFGQDVTGLVSAAWPEYREKSKAIYEVLATVKDKGSLSSAFSQYPKLISTLASGEVLEQAEDDAHDGECAV
jgi:hypothetical protein